MVLTVRPVDWSDDGHHRRTDGWLQHRIAGGYRLFVGSNPFHSLGAFPVPDTRRDCQGGEPRPFLPATGMAVDAQSDNSDVRHGIAVVDDVLGTVLRDGDGGLHGGLAGPAVCVP